MNPASGFRFNNIHLFTLAECRACRLELLALLFFSFIPFLPAPSCFITLALVPQLCFITLCFITRALLHYSCPSLSTFRLQTFISSSIFCLAYSLTLSLASSLSHTHLLSYAFPLSPRASSLASNDLQAFSRRFSEPNGNSLALYNQRLGRDSSLTVYSLAIIGLITKKTKTKILLPFDPLGFS